MAEQLRDQSATQTGLGSNGLPTYRSFVSGKSDVRRTWVQTPPNTVIPVVFVPGIMGSNLKAKVDIRDRKGDVKIGAGNWVWRVDNEWDMKSWPFTSSATRQLYLNKDVLEVDLRGNISHGMLNDVTPLANVPVALARQRGWGEISAMFYGTVLDWLEHQLNGATISPTGEANDLLKGHLENLKGKLPSGVQGKPRALTDDEVKRVTSFGFPVHAFGYNWLDSNLESGRLLAKRIGDITKEYQSRGLHCEKVILITHSMGGLVARAACKAHGAESLVWGVIHGVMPTDGAAATYKRFVAGFGDEGGGAAGWGAGHVLGNTGEDTTPALAYAPGPMELLPNKLYNQGKPWFWIENCEGYEQLNKLHREGAPGSGIESGKCKERLKLPQKGDPYEEIYRRQDVWWRMINPDWLNPAELPERKGKSYLGLHLDMLKEAEAFHTKLGGKFHSNTYAHYGMDNGRRSWGTVGWTAVPEMAPDAPPGGKWESQSSGRVEECCRPLVFTQCLPRAAISLQDVPGDGTVPGLASGAGVDAAAQVVCRQSGYDHDKSYNDPAARQSVLDAILRILALVPEPK